MPSRLDPAESQHALIPRRRNGQALELSSATCVQFLSVPILDDRLKEVAMNGIIYLVGLVVVVLAILSFLGLR